MAEFILVIHVAHRKDRRLRRSFKSRWHRKAVVNVERSSKAVQRRVRCFLVAVRVSHHPDAIFQIALHRLRSPKLRLAVRIVAPKKRLTSNNGIKPAKKVSAETTRHRLSSMRLTSLCPSACRSSLENWPARFPAHLIQSALRV